MKKLSFTCPSGKITAIFSENMIHEADYLICGEMTKKIQALLAPLFNSAHKANFIESDLAALCRHGELEWEAGDDYVTFRGKVTLITIPQNVINFV